jgi:hypothetical protein
MTVEAPPVEQSTTPPPLPPPKPRRRSVRIALFAAIALAAAAVGAAAFLLLGAGDDGGKAGTLEGPSDSNFTITYPDNWRPLSEEEVQNLPGSPLSVLRRDDGKGFVVIGREGPSPKNPDRLMSELGRELQKRVPDFQLRSTKQIKVRAGEALFTSYIRKRTGTVHSIVIIPAGDKTFTLNTISRGGADDVAREIGRIILSFDA